jgi:hypothetical protein
MPFKKGVSGNRNGRPKKGVKIIGIFERSLPRIESEIHTTPIEVARELVIGLAGVIKHQLQKK